jgi:ribonuclease HI
MTYKYEEELREKAQTFIQILLQKGIAVEPRPVMFRDYMVKLAVKDAGYISIYYSPKQEMFSLKLHELRDSRLTPQIEVCWQGDSIISDETRQTADYQAYVDGSYMNGFVGYGAVVLHQGQEIKRFSGSVEHDVELRQVVGELHATLQVIAWCEEHNITDIEIFYDYAGIEKWATGEWRANNTVTQHYQKAVRSTPVKITWRKVKSHTGVRWNDLVDELAKHGAIAQSRESDQPDNPLIALEQKALGFIAFLSSRNIEAEYTQIYNEQYARIIIERGYFDLYNTHKRPMSPYIHGFKDEARQKHIEHLWEQFHLGMVGENVVSEVSGFEEVEYYLSIFAPYRHLVFDFSALVNALSKIVDHESEISLPVDDYDELKRIYEKIRIVQ